VLLGPLHDLEKLLDLLFDELSVLLRRTVLRSYLFERGWLHFRQHLPDLEHLRHLNFLVVEGLLEVGSLRRQGELPQQLLDQQANLHLPLFLGFVLVSLNQFDNLLENAPRVVVQNFPKLFVLHPVGARQLGALIHLNQLLLDLQLRLSLVLAFLVLRVLRFFILAAVLKTGEVLRIREGVNQNNLLGLSPLGSEVLDRLVEQGLVLGVGDAEQVQEVLPVLLLQAMGRLHDFEFEVRFVNKHR